MKLFKFLTRVALVGIVFIGTMASTNSVISDYVVKNVSAAEKPKFNDLEIAHIAYTAGAIDVRYAHLALALSENPEVLKFAALMVRDHTAVNRKALALVKKLQITPQDNGMSQQLSKQAMQIREEFSQLRGNALAKRYAENELGYHKAVNNAVEQVLIPSAQNRELKSLLKAALRTFKVHQGHAEAMNRKVR